MKKVSLVLNIVLIIAVGVLYFLHFNSQQKVTKIDDQVDSLAVEENAAPNGSIVYVNIDTLLQNYDMYYDLSADLNSKQKKLEAELTSKSKTYQQGVSDYQNKVQKGLITRSTAQEIEQQLMQEQQNLMQLRDNMSQQLSEEQQVMNRQLINNIMEYLKKFNKDHDYKYIMSNSFGGPLLYSDKALDITREVLRGINAEYKSTHDEKSK